MANRRDFLKVGSVAGAGMLVSGTGFWPASAADEPPRRQGANDRLNVAIIGAGGQGGGNLANIAGLKENIVALCDTDTRRCWGNLQRFAKVPFYLDFRAMLEKQRNIDAVVVSTPDHQHAVAAAMAIRMGKHAYVEKPLTHDVWEARQLRVLAAKHKVATQMGNQGTSNGNLRTAVEIIRAGAIGDVREVHVWTNRPIWPQGIANRPKPQDAPQGLHWDLWLGTAPSRPYNQAYAPFAWRGWWDYGTGAIGDMACHTMNLAFMALNLRDPRTIAADVAGKVNNETAPEGCTITYEFPERGNLVPCRMMWYERRLPPAEKFMGQTPSGSGCLLVGSKGTLYSPSDYGGEYRLLPMNAFEGYRPPKPTLPRSPGHHAEWIRACKGGPAAMSNFDYAGPLTEMALLGNVAIRVGQRITWDAEKMQCPGCPAADRYIRREYRKGWTL
ncbi:MAG: Gfo/Idh/MocA family oxidoreductase [Planctomycetes bacterium]|nr:Gfo/Idh/MocA family oxidoreductase [Planctomycetota bacterium]